MDLSAIYRTEADYLVIGSGAAGLYAALCAARHGEVAIMTKSNLQASNSAWAQGGIAAAIAADDSPQLHLEDTLAAGRGLCNREAVDLLTREARGCIRDLQNLGVQFDRNGSGPDLGREGGHGRRRILHANGAATGEHLVAVLTRRLNESRVHVAERTWATALVGDGVRCFGALAYDGKIGAPRLFLAKTTILASGGAAGLFHRTTNPPTATGEGVALAYLAGAEVMDMEFVQFHPTALYTEGGRSLLISESVRGEGAILLDAAGRHFMPEYHPLGDLAPRDVVAKAIREEMSKSGSPCVFLKLTHLGSEFPRKRFPSLHRACLEQGFDLTRDLLPVAPAAHYCVGGVRTDLDGRTSLAGLSACGEVAANGVHGANRLASNSLLECFVFARRAVEAAAGEPMPEFRLPDQAAEVAEAPAQPDGASGLARRVGEILTEKVGLVRDRDGLAEAERLLRQLAERANSESRAYFNRFQAARLIAETAALRTESRGVHMRSDFPEEDSSWRRHIVLKRGNEPRFVDI